MKVYGDMPERDRELVKELIMLESFLNKNSNDLPLLSVAKVFVCLGHDYYCIYQDEEGDRLFRKAETLCPGYFKGPIFSDMRKDPEFHYLVENIKTTPGFDLLVSFGFEDEK